MTWVVQAAYLWASRRQEVTVAEVFAQVNFAVEEWLKACGLPVSLTVGARDV